MWLRDKPKGSAGGDDEAADRGPCGRCRNWPVHRGHRP